MSDAANEPGADLPVLQDGVTLLSKIIKQHLDAGDLDTEERRKVLDVLDGPYAAKTGKACYTQEEMAVLLQVSRTTINRDLKVLRRRRGHLVTRSDLVDAAGELRRAKLLVQQSARDENDMSLFWRVELEYIQALQRLGILSDAGATLNLSGQISVEHRHAFRSFSEEATADLLKIARGDRGVPGGDRLHKAN